MFVVRLPKSAHAFSLSKKKKNCIYKQGKKKKEQTILRRRCAVMLEYVIERPDWIVEGSLVYVSSGIKVLRSSNRRNIGENTYDLD